LLLQQLRKEWRARGTADEFRETLGFEAGRLLLGAGTVVADADRLERADAGAFGEARLAALLSVAYGPQAAAGAMGHVKAAVARRGAGDLARADLHLALSRLGRLSRPQDAARRLFMADGLMRGGVTPEAIMNALSEGPAESGDLLKYDPDQPRVPAGSGRTSGEWTSSGGTAESASPSKPSIPGAEAVRPSAANDALATEPATAASADAATGHAVDAAFVSPAPAVPSLARLSPTALRGLVGFISGVAETGGFAAALTAGGAIATLGVLFIPSRGPRGQWVHVGGPGDVSYYHNPDELAFLLRYTTPDGVQHTLALSPDPNGDYRGPGGDIVARAVRSAAKAGVIISTAALVGDQAGKPQLCPAPAADRNLGPLGKAYENYMKSLFNPGHPTPDGMAYYVPNPASGKLPAIDDCQQQTRIFAEYKGPGFEKHMRKKDVVWNGMVSGIEKQSLEQAQATENTHLIWYFAEKSVADHFREEFKILDSGRERIGVEWAPMP
jgi:hypothetical protein